jgi:chaperonin GroES
MTTALNSWHPLGDQILVRPLIAADRTASGLYLPDQHRERPQSGVVLALGPRVPPGGSLDVGDLVAYGKFAGVTFTLDTGEDVLLMRETEILARKVAGEYALTEHTVTVGLAPRTVAHEAGSRCEHCPEEPKSEVIAEERARLVQPFPGPSTVLDQLER